MPWPAGKLEVEEHGLVLLDENSKPIAPIIEISSNPKIFLPIANCLVGHCTGPQCMVTTFLGRLGVRQMCGYTVRTWFGRAGWGTLDLWKSVPGRLTLADTYFLHQARMTYDLKSINPRLLSFKFNLNDDDPGYETVVEQLNKEYHLDKDNIDDKVLQDIYGDLAFIATLNDKILTAKFLRTGKTAHQFIIEYKDIETAQNFHLPIGNLFINRIENYNIINGFEYVPILSDNFLILLKPIPLDEEITIIKIDFHGTIIQ